MPSKILTKNIISIDAFIHDPSNLLNNTKDDIIAIFANNTPMFYVITPVRLAQLLDIEAHLTYPASNIALNMQLLKKPVTSTTIRVGKFAMYNGWQPDADFQRQAALWGITLMQPVKPEELVAFIDWWRAEGKIFTHIQWQQKLARSVQICRANFNSKPKRDINIFSHPDKQIPPGFRGTK